MKLLIVRHGQSVPASAFGLQDSERFLSADGREEVRRVAELVASETRINQLWTSPLVRAVQTAELFGQIAGGPQLVCHVQPELAIDGSVVRLVRRLRDLRDEGQVLALVGHMPAVLRLSVALAGKAAPQHFLTGQVLAVDWTPQGTGSVAWNARPNEAHLSGP